MSNFESYQRLKIFALTIVILVLSAVAFMFYRSAYSSNHPADKKFLIETVEIDGKALNVNLAVSEEEKITGLSGTESLAGNWGKLFVYQKPLTPSFWMRGMNFPIDIIWIDNGRVIETDRNLPPDNGEATYTPDSPVDAVLETPAGWVDEKNIVKGDRVMYK